jgi:uncharacterized protein
MTDINAEPLASPETTSADAPAIQSPFADWPGSAPWQPLPDAARRSFMLSGLIYGAVFSVAFASLPLLMFFENRDFNLRMLLWPLSLSLLSFALFFWRARLAFAYARWTLDDDGLRVRRGRYWRREILIPRARVQHLDVERGPIERRYGLATLIVHTAGTRLQALRQPGFDEATAARLRDALVPQHRETDNRETDHRETDGAGNAGDSIDDIPDNGKPDDSESTADANATDDAANVVSHRASANVDPITTAVSAIPAPTVTDDPSSPPPSAPGVRSDPA